ncbi:Creatinine amidohydrolase [compost metagenome]
MAAQLPFVGGRMTRSVSFHELRPEQIADRKRRLPVAYLAFGILEWHGLHNPYGLDGLKAHGIAQRLAEELGGLVMPPMYWGDHRGEICERHLDRELPLADSAGLVWNAADTMCGTLEVPRDAYKRNAERSVRNGGWRLFKELAVHAFFQIESYGFTTIVAIPGHYPLLNPMTEAIEQYKQDGGVCSILIINDAKYSYSGKGDHAAAYETSLLMALQPDTVDIGRLDPDLATPLAGVALGPDPRTHAFREYGEEALGKLIEDMKLRLSVEAGKL